MLQALQVEKIKIINYMQAHDYLPAGNKITNYGFWNNCR